MDQRSAKRSVDTALIESKFASSKIPSNTMSAPVSDRYETAAPSASTSTSPGMDNPTDQELFDLHVKDTRDGYFANVTQGAALEAEADLLEVAELPGIVEEYAQNQVEQIARESSYDMKRTREKMTSLDGTVTLRFTGFVDVPDSTGVLGLIDAHAAPADSDKLKAILMGKKTLNSKPCNGLVTVTGASTERHVGSEISWPISPLTKVKPFYIEVDKVVPSQNCAVTISAEVAGKDSDHSFQNSVVVMPDKCKRERCVDLYWIRPSIKVRLAGAAVSKARGDDSEAATHALFKSLNDSIIKHKGAKTTAPFVEETMRTVTLHRQGRFTDGGNFEEWTDLQAIVELMNNMFSMEDASVIAMSTSGIVTVPRSSWESIVEIISTEAAQAVPGVHSDDNVADFVTLEQALSFRVSDHILAANRAVVDNLIKSVKDASAAKAPAGLLFEAPRVLSASSANKYNREKIMFSGIAVVYMGTSLDGTSK